jgi:transposase
MITLPRTVRVWAYGRPADLRKGYNGLAGIVEREFRADPLCGDLFLFVNSKRTGCKVLLFDGTGLCIFMKRLERGRFSDLWRDRPADEPLRMTASELALFIEGCALVGRRPLSPAEITRNDLAARDPM